MLEKFRKDYDELRSNIRLDKYNLDEQLCDHPERLRRVYELLNACEDELRLVEADLDQQIRADAAKVKDKLTETEIKRMMAQDARVAELKLSVDQLHGLKDVYIERRHTFGRLCELHRDQYWSGASASKRVDDPEGRQAQRQRIIAKRRG